MVRRLKPISGVLYEMASAEAEAAAAASIEDPLSRSETAIKVAIRTMNSFGVTAIQDAATMGPLLEALHSVDEKSQLFAHVVASMPSRPFLEAGTTGPELNHIAEKHRSTHVHPDFSKYVLDGVPFFGRNILGRDTYG